MTDKATQIYKLVKNSDGEIETVPLEQVPSLRPASSGPPSRAARCYADLDNRAG